MRSRAYTRAGEATLERTTRGRVAQLSALLPSAYYDIYTPYPSTPETVYTLDGGAA